ncbi:RagB/SusD family nutrient uptake outer membrane protein [Mucilaginibacter sp.]|uniref:RagB/SusD family nutrient uptake outer membrane protein n=1 Tax=Mucilaginibacter sp. TaxID=1882438 RepID=UPI0026346A0D|nr:RagB/SusD family nutrient uptake outer membrane protein [Mucilaginibacter sp.]MDB5031967.1 SusD family protein [Mucilaginibacter sp.]
MKRNLIIILLGAGLLGGSLMSCNKNKIITPNDQVTSAQVYSTPAGYKQALAKVYGSFALTGNTGPAGSGDVQGIDEGTSDFFRLFWCAQELPTDEAVIAWGDPGLPDFHAMSWSSSNPILTGLYYRSLYQITLCNDFIRQSSDANLSSRGITGADVTNIHYYVAEARFLRAYQYWVLMDLFGNPPFVTDATAVGSTIPPQTTRAALFTYVESELKAIDGLLVAPLKNEYGRADQAAAWALLARLYLNAGVYTGTPRYTDAVTYAQKVIAAGYTLIPKYDNLMLADNNIGNTEAVLTINYDGAKTQGYGGTTFLKNAQLGGSMPAPLYGTNQKWAGIRVTKNIVNLFPAPQDTSLTYFPNNKNIDTRAEFWTRGQSLDINDVTSFTDGYAVNKFRNVTAAGATGTDLTYSDIDMPLFRLSEMYLIYAEAVLRGGTGGDNGTALTYINNIRTRAYGSAAGNITSAQLTTSFILDERARELYWEGLRRTDLIRYDQFTTANYVWPFKGGVKLGTSVASFRNLYPIPDQDRAVNPNLKQNAGY